MSTLNNILLLDPFYAGSHKQLTDLLYRNIVGCDRYVLSGKKWHWRARTAALVFSQMVPKSEEFRVLFTTSVLNLPELVALRPDLSRLKKIVYFHENQLVYPVRKHKDRDFQYGYNQILTCLVADVVIFNSKYNMESFLSSINSFLNLMPDYRPKGLANVFRPKCQVISFPLEIPESTTALGDSLRTDFSMSETGSSRTDFSMSETGSSRTDFSMSETGSSMDTLTIESSNQDVTIQTSLPCSQSDSCIGDQSCNLSCYIEGEPVFNQTCHPDIDINNINSTCHQDIDVNGICHTDAYINRTCHLDTDINTKECMAAKNIKFVEDSNAKYDKLDDCSTLTSSKNQKESHWDGSDNCRIQNKSYIQERKFENCDTPALPTCLTGKGSSMQSLHIVWPHRWEHDKDPETFFKVMYQLHEEGLEFHLSVIGQQYSQVPAIFEVARQKLSAQIRTWGYQEKKSDYYRVLQQADCVVSTALHEFFGVAMLEAVYFKCFPLCPKRLVYPELFPEQYLYSTPNQLYKRLREFCRRPHLVRSHKIKVDAEKYMWKTVQSEFENLLCK